MDSTAKWPLPAVLFLVTMIVLGAYLRFADLSTKLFWGDETYTALRVSGQTQAQLDTLSDGAPHTLAALVPYQSVHRDVSPAATANSLAVDEPQHPPLFFVAERLWAGMFGSSPAALRALSALAGLLGIPAMYWLCMELFGRRIFALYGAALNAVSPFFVTYAHEAREYAAWGTLTTIATAALLATRRNPRWWIAYAVTVAAGLYLDMLSVWIVIAHAVVVVTTFPRRARAIAAFAGAIGAAIVGYLPWIVAFLQHRAVIAQGLNWASGSISPLLYIGKLIFAASSTFFDLSFENIAWLPVTVAVCAAIAAALVVTARRAQPDVRATILALALTSPIAFVAGDLYSHTYYATGARYDVPAWIALELAVAYLLVQIAQRAPRIARTALAAVLILGCVSSLRANASAIWWDNHDDADVPGMARVIDGADRPVVLSEHTGLPKLLVLSHTLKPDTRFALIWTSHARIDGDSAGDGTAFVLKPSAALLARLRAAGCRLAPIAIRSAATATSDRIHDRLLAEQGARDAGLWNLARCPMLPHLALSAPATAR